MTASLGLLVGARAARAADSVCAFSVLNRTVTVRGNTWVLPNVPANFGRVRVRATCVENGVTRFGHSDWFTVPTNGIVDVPEISFATLEPIPSRLVLSAPGGNSLTGVGISTQLSAMAELSTGTPLDVTPGIAGTNYTISNPAIATVSLDGLVTAVSSGTVLVTAMNDGATGMIRIQVVTSSDSDGDGIPDDVELANGMNPNDPVDALEDFDRDGLINRDEIALGTGLRNADTDADGFLDGREVDRGTDPLVVDTDGDGVADGLEVQTGSNPLDANSLNLAQALLSISATPGSLAIVYNTVFGEVSRRLNVTGALLDGRSINLTSFSRGTVYASADLTIANFGGDAGEVFAGQNGSTTITVTNSGHTATVPVTVTSFSPTALSSLTIPGYANNVDVAGGFAYVAAGSAGLQVVDLADRRNPRIVGSLDTPGVGIDVRVVGSLAYVADGTSGVSVIDVTNPALPMLLGRVDTPGDAQDLVVRDGIVYVADGPQGLAIIDARSPESPVILGQIDTPGIARGVDISDSMAVLADSGTLRVVDITNPTLPVLRGSLAIPGGDARDVTVRDGLAYVSAYLNSLQVVSLANPATPALVGNGPSSVARDFEMTGGLGIVANQVAVAAMAVYGLETPSSPGFRALLDVSQFGTFSGTGMAVDTQFAYMTAQVSASLLDYGSTGDTRLLIGQLLDVQDDLDVAPSVTLTAPGPSDTLFGGQSIKLTATATDDVLVSSVTFRVDGMPVGTDTFAPYELSYVLPVGTNALSFSASAVDPGGNEGVSNTVDVVVTPDPDPPAAAQITSPASGQTVSGTVTLSATAVDALSGVERIEVRTGATLVATLRGPAFSQPWNTGVLSDGAHILVARAFDGVGNGGPESASVPIVVNNVSLTVSLTSPTAGSAVRDSVIVSASTNHPVDRVDFEVGAASLSDTTFPYGATLDLSAVPEGNLSVRATAFAAGGETALAVVQIAIDRTPPADPDLSRMTSEASGGVARVSGGAGAVEAGATVEITNTVTGAVVVVAAGPNGAFLTPVVASVGDALSIVAIDRAGNRSFSVSTIVQLASGIDGVPVGMMLWVRADAGVTTDGSGRVTSWSDQSGANNHLTQSATADQPTYVAGAVNGMPVVRFDGASDSVRFTTTLTNIRSVFWVLKEDVAASSTYRAPLGHPTRHDFEGGLTTLWRPDCCVSPDVTLGDTRMNGTPVSGTTTPRPKAMSVVSVITTADVAADRFGTAASIAPWWGDLAELLIYDRPLLPSERQSVEDYLARKYRPYAPSTGVPAISPAGGTFVGSRTVVLKTSTPDAEIFYTTDGSTPTTASPKYASEISLTETTTLRAIAVKPGFSDSGVAVATFLKAGVSTLPVNGPLAANLALWLRADAGIATDGGEWVTRWEDQSGRGNHAAQSNGVKVPRFIRNEVSGLPAVRFDGADDFVQFTSPISTIRTVFWVVKESTSATDTHRALLGHPTLRHFEGGQSPTTIWRVDCCVSPDVVNGLTWVNGVPVDGRQALRPRSMSVVSVTTAGSVTADRFGTAASIAPWWGDLVELLIYDRALDVDERRAVEDQLISRYEIGSTVTPPVISPGGGPFTGSVDVTLTSGTPGAYATYTTDGSEPTEASQLYVGPITLTTTTTLKARAFRAGLGPSSTVSAVFDDDSQFQPRDVTGMALWLRADAGVPSGFGDLWLDQSGANHHATQTDGKAVPRIVPGAAPNGLPTMRFDGSADFVSFPQLSNIRTVFWVVREDVAASQAYRALLGHPSLHHFEGGFGAPGTIWRSDCCASSFVVNGQTWLNGQPIDGRVINRPRVLSVISVVTAAPVTADRFGTAALMSPWWGDLAELLIYERVLDQAERRRVEDYLVSKYSIGTSVTPPLISPPGATFSGDQIVTLSVGTTGATIRYTLDGSEPSALSNEYTGAISLSDTTILKAKAFRADLTPSSTATAMFEEDSDFQPRDLPDLTLWLRADAGVSTGFGDLWPDQSGSNNHATQSDWNSAPRVVPGANGLPAMRFDGSLDFVRFPQLSTIRTVFWVVREDVAATSAYRALLGHGSLHNFEGGIGTPGTIWRPDCCVSPLVADGQTTWLNGISVNGRTTLRPRVMSLISLVTTGPVTSDRFGTGPSILPWWGELAELIVYERALTDLERRSVEDYLNAKYSLFVR